MRSASTIRPFLSLLIACSSLFARAQSPEAERFDHILSHYYDRGFLNGSVLIADHGKVIYARGFGEADRTTHTLNTPHTQFDIGSITKQFTAALVLQQVQEGRIRLDAAISDYLPGYRSDTGKRITVEQLLHHTSGLPPDYDSPAFNATALGATPYEPQPFVEEFCQPDLTATPGTQWHYSNCGYDILGLILERVTGLSYESLLKEKILEPLGMRDTGLDHNSLQLPNRARGYERHLGPTYAPGPFLDLTHIYAAGAMYSTVEDLLRWNQALSSDILFSRETREEIFRPGLGDWGYGWFVTTIPADQPGAGSRLAEMRGDMPGNFFSSIMRFPDQDAVIIILRNGYGSSERLEPSLQAVMFDQSPRLPWRKPADVVVRAWQSTAALVQSHPVLSWLAAILCLALVLRQRRRVARCA